MREFLNCVSTMASLSSDLAKTPGFTPTPSKGQHCFWAWQINHQFFDEHRADATPTLGTAERWILRNEGGGWWHPIHIHLESHQQVRQEEAIPPLEDRFKSDTATLGAGTEIEIFMKFRTFKGPFVFHCHNLAHEDMRMMFVFDPRIEPTPSPQPIQQSFP